jgi:hypothetical protein
MDLWPRIKAAIYAASVSRSAVEFMWPECHKPRCNSHHHDSPDEAFGLMTDRIADSVYVELLCKAVTEPDLGDEAAA